MSILFDSGRKTAKSNRALFQSDVDNLIERIERGQIKEISLTGIKPRGAHARYGTAGAEKPISVKELLPRLVNAIHSQHSKVSKLTINNADMDDEDAKTASQLTRQLTLLNLAHNNITHVGALELAMSIQGTGLKEFDISYNPIGDIGANPLLNVAKQEHTPSLSRLSMLFCSGITDQTHEHALEIIPQSNLLTFSARGGMDHVASNELAGKISWALEANERKLAQAPKPEDTRQAPDQRWVDTDRSGGNRGGNRDRW